VKRRSYRDKPPAETGFPESAARYRPTFGPAPLTTLVAFVVAYWVCGQVPPLPDIVNLFATGAFALLAVAAVSRWVKLRCTP